MLDIGKAKILIHECLKYGGDFAELYFEDTTKHTLELTKESVTKCHISKIKGIGIRILEGTKEVYGYTNNLELDNIIKLCTSLSKSFRKQVLKVESDLIESPFQSNTPILIYSIPLQDKIKMAKLANKTMYEYSRYIVQAITSFTDAEQHITIANSLGLFKHDIRKNLRLSCQAIARNGEITQTSNDSYGLNSGYESYKNFDVIEFATKIAASAKTILFAEEMVAGEIPVIINNGFGGVILHEAIGHSLEASSVGKGLSVFSGLEGTQIASPLITAIDDGTIRNAWGSINIDDEGTEAQKNVLIENGILKGFMIDFLNSRKMNHLVTGSSRRESYHFPPTSRMTNTFIQNGDSTFDEIIRKTNYGLFAKKLGGGSVNPQTGEFNFAVQEGYIVEMGKIKYPVRGATLVGNGKDILKRVDMVGNNLSFGNGFCGAQSGSIPVNVGQPTIRLTLMTVGGKAAKNGL